jgi:hypothetical protein
VKRHPLDILSLVFGLVFLAVGVTFLIPADAERLAESVVNLANWGGPALVLAAGLGLLASSLRRQRRESPPEAGPDL